MDKINQMLDLYVKSYEMTEAEAGIAAEMLAGITPLTVSMAMKLAKAYFWTHTGGTVCVI